MHHTIHWRRDGRDNLDFPVSLGLCIILAEDHGMTFAKGGWKIFGGGALLLAVVFGCASSHQHPTDDGRQQVSARLTGTVTYRVRMVLPPNALIRVELVDISRRDGPALTIGLQEIETGGRQVPVPFEIPYSPATIDPGRTYAVQARILLGNRLLFINTSTYRVLTNGVRYDVEVIVEPVHLER